MSSSSSDSPTSAPIPRRKKRKLRKVDEGDHALQYQTNVPESDPSSLLSSAPNVDFSTVSVPPVDPGILLRVPTTLPKSTAPVEMQAKSCSPQRKAWSADNSTKTGCTQASFSSAGRVVTPKDLEVLPPISCKADFLNYSSTSSQQDFSPGTVLPVDPPLDVTSIFSNMKLDSKIVSADKGCELEWHNFLNVEAPKSPSFEDHPEDGTDSDGQTDMGPHQGKQNCGQPLFAGSPLFVEDAVISILTYAITEHLTGQAFSRLLNLLKILLPQPNKLPSTLAQLYKYLDSEGELKVFYFCNMCWKSRTSAKDVCTECSDPKRQVKYFITSPLAPQLSKLFARPGFFEKLSYKNNRQKVSAENIEDLYDGEVYKSAEATVLSSSEPNSLHISFTWYTDGISIYESSPYSLWPFMLIINELPPSERYKPENLILAGLWGCDEKPHPNIFLLPIYYEMMTLSQGVSMSVHGCEDKLLVKGFLLQGTCDVPARAAFANMKGHAGYSSCPKCFIVGEKSPATGKVMAFPHEHDLQPRTSENYYACVTESLRTKEGYLGVFGPTILSYMTFSDFISSLAIDKMHCIDIGLTKQLLNLWFNSSHSSEKFSMSQQIDVVNKRLLAIRLPHFVQRVPLGVDKLAYWKASLLRNFLMVMSLPVLEGIMPQDMFENLTLLVTGIALLSQTSISHADLVKADQCLNLFSEGFQVIYGKRNMSSNLHLVRHLAQTVEETGNLWVSSCYKFEDLNGKLSLLAHGTVHASFQIYSHFFALSELDVYIRSMNASVLKTFCKQLISPKMKWNLGDKICPSTYVVGPYGKDCRYKTEIEELLQVMVQPPTDYQTFSRMFRNGKLYSSVSYSRGLRVSYYCRYTLNDSVLHGKILVFLKSLPENQYYALISSSVMFPAELERYWLDSGIVNNTALIPVTDLQCVSFSVSIDDKIFVTDPLNSYEME